MLTNSAPQWQPFNAGNWARVEEAIRSYAKSTQQGNTLYIVTGTGTFIFFPYFVFKNIESSGT